MPGYSVSEIHSYPLRPEEFEEPLFLALESRKEIAEHLARSGWLSRASQVGEGSGAAAKRGWGEARRVRVFVCGDGGVYLVTGCERRIRKRRVANVIERWREVRDWWNEDEGTDLYVYRLGLSEGSVVDVARDRRGGAWALVGIFD